MVSLTTLNSVTSSGHYQTCYTTTFYRIALPFSCFRRFLLLHIFTAHTERIIATMKNNIPPTTPAVMALCFTRAGTGNLTSSLLS